MAIGKSAKPLLDEKIYESIKDSFGGDPSACTTELVLKEPVLSQKFQEIASRLLATHAGNLSSCTTDDDPKQLESSLAALKYDIYIMLCYGYCVCDRARDIEWEQGMNDSWEEN